MTQVSRCSPGSIQKTSIDEKGALMKSTKRTRMNASSRLSASGWVVVLLASCTAEDASEGVQGEELDATPKPDPNPDKPKPGAVDPEPPCDSGELHGRLYDASRNCFDYHDDEAERQTCVDERVIESCGDDTPSAVLTSSGECWQLPFRCYTLPDGWSVAKGEGCADAPECSASPDGEPEPPFDAGGDTPGPSEGCSEGFATLNGLAFDTVRRCFDFANEGTRRSACVSEDVLNACGDDVPMPIVSPEWECWLLPFICHTYSEEWSSAMGHACERAAECREGQVGMQAPKKLVPTRTEPDRTARGRSLFWSTRVRAVPSYDFSAAAPP
jgi:hypothetical protein